MYSSEEKNKALRLLQEGQKVSAIAKTTGISATTLYKWKKEMHEQEVAKPSEAVQTTSGDKQEIKGIKNTETKKFVPASKLEQIEEESEKRKFDIERNKLIGTLIKKFTIEIKQDKEAASKTLQTINQLISEALAENPNDKYTISYAIKVAKLQGHTGEAINLLQRRLEIIPDDRIALRELARLNEIEKSERRAFFDRYEELKAEGNLDELENLIRERLKKAPNDSKTKNQLAGVLLDRIALSPSESEEMITEVRKMLYELKAANPNNLRIVSNLIRLEKLTNNRQGMQEYLRELISKDPNNYKAKTQLAQIFLDQYSNQTSRGNVPQTEIIEEARTLVEQVLAKHPNNRVANLQMSKILRIMNQLRDEEMAIRKLTEAEPDNLISMSQLAGSLIASCYEDIKKAGNIDANDPRILEAKQICLKIAEVEPRNLYNITHLTHIAGLEGNMEEEKRLLRLKISIDPNDTKAISQLKNLNEKIKERQQRRKDLATGKSGTIGSRNRRKNRGYDDKKGCCDDEFTVEDFTPESPDRDNTDNAKKSPLEKYKTELKDSIDTKNRNLTIKILEQMLQDPAIDETSKKKVRVMLDLAKSSKPGPQIRLKSEVNNIGR